MFAEVVPVPGRAGRPVSFSCPSQVVPVGVQRSGGEARNTLLEPVPEECRRQAVALLLLLV